MIGNHSGGGRTACRICGAPTEFLFRSDADLAILSSATSVSGSTLVDLCRSCGHSQTEPIVNLNEYYSSDYRYRTRTDDEDDLYDRVEAGNVYRSDHQAVVAAAKLDFSRPMRVLDYGCGKARSLKLLVDQYPLLKPHVFDVSEAYREYWCDFVGPEQQACFTIPGSWLGTMDAVLSFFALEHADSPCQFVAELRSVLQPGGALLVIVPNVLRNPSDLLVVDHVNHFSATSIEKLLTSERFVDVVIDEDSFRGAFVVYAIRGDDGEPARDRAFERQKLAAVTEIAQFWRAAVDRIRAAESSHSGKAAIYGSGIYGQFIAGVLRDRGRVSCFLDQNPWRQGTSCVEIPVRPPSEIPDDIRLVYVGLNPVLAREAISRVPALHSCSRDYFFL
jgi:SAM-dependent methyltransferase